MALKPMLASDLDLSKVRFPVMGQPKIDGVRALHINGQFSGRSLKQFKNRYLNSVFNHPVFKGLDGELAAEIETHRDLCRLTTSATSTIEGEPFVQWHVFDYVCEATAGLTYAERYQRLQARLTQLRANADLIPEAARGIVRLKLVPAYRINSEGTLKNFNDWALDEGYEGIIIRDPDGLYKSGRSTVREGGLLRHKVFDDAEARVLRVEEGQTNGNEATVNELGYTERSTHKANMIPNGQVGRLICKDLETGAETIVSPGRMSHSERVHYMQNPSEIVGRIVKYQHFSKGVKDKRRFATFQCFRDPVDMG